MTTTVTVGPMTDLMQRSVPVHFTRDLPNGGSELRSFTETRVEVESGAAADTGYVPLRLMWDELEALYEELGRFLGRFLG